MHKAKQESTHLTMFILGGVVLYFLSGMVDELRVYQGATIAVYVIAISSIILLTGYSGQVSLGHGALMAVGAYAAAVLRIEFNLPIILCFVVAVLAAAIGGALLGAAAARLSGPYLAGTTLALAIGLPSLANQFEVLGGEQGLLFDVGFPPLALGEEFTQYKWFFWIAALAALISMWVVRNLLNSAYGRAWKAGRGNEVAAQLTGINTARSKVLAFTISAGIAGLAGALLAMTIGTVSPSAFPLSLSFAVLTGAVLAGITTLGGVILGAVVLVIIPELADVIAHRLGAAESVTINLPGLIVSGLLILTVLFVPNGPVEQHRARKAKHSALLGGTHKKMQ
ncbi:MAG: branched-chain amino acid ABC transporter permease [Actinomycetales bacterium]|nr:branched-chain amino acid ABC transporter permease [Actinomycetales bacterium]